VVHQATGELWLYRRGEEIVPDFVRCSGPQATVRNVDQIVLHGEFNSVHLVPRDGPFAPGATPEAAGAEIEIVVYGEHLEMDGTARGDTIVAKTLADERVAVDWNRQADGAVPDFDVILADGIPKFLQLNGIAGDDVIDARPLTGMGDVYGRREISLRAGKGDDRVFGSRGGESPIKDGPGDDVVRAGAGVDFVDFGRGRDRIYGGPGNDDLIYGVFREGHIPPDLPDRVFGGGGPDQIIDINGHPDLIRCGRGRDEVERERFDRVAADCEHLR